MFKLWFSRIGKISILMAVLLPLVQSCIKPKSLEIDKLDGIYTLSTDSVVPLFSSYTLPNCHLQINLEVPSSCESNKILVSAKEMIITLNQDGNASHEGSNIEEMMKEYTKAYILDYLSEGKDAIANYEGDITATTNWMCYEEIRNGKIIFNQQGFFSYSVSQYSYTGGAHGNSSNKVATLDLCSNKQLQLRDILLKDNLSTVKEIFLKQLAAQSGVNSVEDLRENSDFFNIDDIEMTENFYISNEGLTFVYDPIEIAPYSSGEITVTLSWNDLNEHINPKSNVIKFLED